MYIHIYPADREVIYSGQEHGLWNQTVQISALLLTSLSDLRQELELSMSGINHFKKWR